MTTKRTRRKSVKCTDNQLITNSAQVSSLKHAGGRPRTWQPEDILTEANYLREYAKLDDSIVLAKCYGIRGYSHETAHRFENECEEFKDAKRFAKTIIGARREELGLQGKIDASIVRSGQATYDREHLEALKLMKTVMQLKAQGASGESLAIQVISFDSQPTDSQ